MSSRPAWSTEAVPGQLELFTLRNPVSGGKKSQTWLMPLIPAHQRLRQEDNHRFEFSLNCIESSMNSEL